MTTYRTEYLDQENRRVPKTNLYCIACHKDLKPGTYGVIHLVDGGPFMLHPEDEELYYKGHPAGDLGCFPIGKDCAKKVEPEWVGPNEHWPQ